MSDTTQNRFEIDLEEIERQLRRSAEMAPPSTYTPSSDPLAELARIVGQDDPFAKILAIPDNREPPQVQSNAALGRLTQDPVLTDEERDVLGTGPAAYAVEVPRLNDRLFDPVVETYGSAEHAFASSDFEPLPPRRSRGRLFAVLAVLVLAVGAAGAAFTWRRGVSFVSSGPPPLIKADNAPLKVAPENPGGMDIPNQSRQIYERSADNAQSRVLDRQEQPIDVREAARQMPVQPAPVVPAAPKPSVAPAQAQRTASADPAARIPAPAPAPVVPAPQVEVWPPPPVPNAVSAALGEPRRVRTVAVRPDGSSATGAPVPGVGEPGLALVPTTMVPPPVPVVTISVPANGAMPSQPAPAAASTGGLPAITVLPPQRPGAARITVDAVADAAVPPALVEESARGDQPAVPTQPPPRPGRSRVAAASPDATPDAVPGRGWAVQIATRPSEEAARAAYDQLSDRFATDLGGKAATVTSAEVAGKTVYRVRVTPLSREAANTLCIRLKSSGGACFVTAN